ncbi:DNA-binding transcriptional LysR family regulator [Silvimonas terrae]|uniref:DNA-binding transcriptional LysR family regulator n=1 Tax=Silvimonas terrae TaxID=300266 RepID=A0A840RJG6_9NEIS|nr:LysR substrate-binding domain-containing protein [Silvimonas terrae]MBB5192392.1 DNA-binding transcriptional LysR family regulator [Silvimonas terrae]
MELRHLRYFVAVAEEGHFGRAAERLHIVQPALSMQIKALEEELGGPLFVRTSRKVTLTTAGSALLTEARRTLEQAERARAVVADSLSGDVGSVRIGFAGNAVFSGQLTADLHRFHRAHPKAQLEVAEVSPQLQMAALLEGRIDIAYCPDHGGLAAPGLDMVLIGEWPLLAAMATDHPLTGRVHIGLSDIAAEPLIVYSAEDSDHTLDVLRAEFGREPVIAHRASNTLSVVALAAAGLGVALVPASLADIAMPGITYRHIMHPDLAARLVRINRQDETTGAVLAYLALADAPADEQDGEED